MMNCKCHFIASVSKNRRNRSSPIDDSLLNLMAKELLSNTNYPLFSHRMLYPEQYLHPSASTESKRALLISLAPMLNEAERQRQSDAADCERATNCRSIKSRVKSGASQYEYFDIRSGSPVPSAEFEKRFLENPAFIYSLIH